MTLITSPESILDIATAAMQSTEDQRLKTLVVSLTKHLHQFVLENQLTEKEFERALQFLVDIGQATGKNTNEVVLAADILGVSSLVSTINNLDLDGGSYAALLGPFWRKNAPLCAWGESISRTDLGGQLMEVRGLILDEDKNPISSAIVDVWHSSPVGFYENQDENQIDMNLRGRFETNEHGEFFFRTIRPAGYPVPTDGPCGELLRAQKRHPNRPAHIHFMISKPGYKVLITQVFDATDKNLESDPVFGVSKQLVGNYLTDEKTGICKLNHAFVLQAGEMIFPAPPIP
ncbi:catechol 1,2-dioxygenase [Polynucleobacter tropicus]|uniref:Catechol 1,2-dioxygenase n=1 Tax=Polynucleobacter tropicus TaxID=1743174 RepID=A0A6M9Q4R4_9BURK|nr:dioxygenase [Polynucleobacter tropicus]QKM65236.1 catechol 1,2-dioxygenase [Polynucleobacter tropicus]